ncbi:MAG: methionine synthase [Clostridia bacterium]|nr:methionine synthase [Clostridia bacterium]
MQQLIDEALRYLGVRGMADETLRSQLTVLANEFSSLITPRHIWRIFPLRRASNGILSGNILLTGSSAAKMLAECGSCAVMVCTLGTAFDAWLQRMQARDMARAVMLDALGSALIESACDKVETEIAGRFPKHYLTDRFSPGYGDLPLALQPELLSAAEAQRIGVGVTDTCMLTPQKSVTALVGIAETPQAARIRGCAYCAMNKTCTLRKAGMTCDL